MFCSSTPSKRVVTPAIEPPRIEFGKRSKSVHGAGSDDCKRRTTDMPNREGGTGTGSRSMHRQGRAAAGAEVHGQGRVQCRAGSVQVSHSPRQGFERCRVAEVSV